jgi:hypothetical protein
MENNDNFSIDFFELIFLAESIIPPRPIARSMAFDDLSEKHYHKMTNAQRLQFFEFVQKQHNFSLENEQCQHFYARFNPKNQYLVTGNFKFREQITNCYYFDDEYRVNKNQFKDKKHITKIVRVHDSKTIKE